MELFSVTFFRQKPSDQPLKHSLQLTAVPELDHLHDFSLITITAWNFLKYITIKYETRDINYIYMKRAV